MTIGVTVDALVDEVVTALEVAKIPDVACVLRSVSAESLMFRESLGQLPAIGVRLLGGRPQEALSAGYDGLRRQRVAVSLEIAIAVQDETNDAARLDRATAIWGHVWDTLSGYRTAVTDALVAYSCQEWGDVQAPRLDLTVWTQQISIDIVTA